MGRHLPETKRRLQREYRERHRDRLREKRKHERRALKMEALAHYGMKCVECGIDDPRVLQIDHVDDNGAEERATLGGQKFAGWRFYYWLKMQGWPDGYQTLCANHNLIKYFGDEFMVL